MAKRRKFTNYERKTVYANGNGRCALCGKPIDFAKMTIDHKLPLSKGGTNEMGNLQPACLTCNVVKSDLTMQELVDIASQIIRRNRYSKIKYLFTKEAI